MLIDHLTSTLVEANRSTHTCAVQLSALNIQRQNWYASSIQHLVPHQPLSKNVTLCEIGSHNITTEFVKVNTTCRWKQKIIITIKQLSFSLFFSHQSPFWSSLPLCPLLPTISRWRTASGSICQSLALKHVSSTHVGPLVPQVAAK